MACNAMLPQALTSRNADVPDGYARTGPFLLKRPKPHEKYILAPRKASAVRYVRLGQVELLQ
jgi:hypothetical protein